LHVRRVCFFHVPITPGRSWVSGGAGTGAAAGAEMGSHSSLDSHACRLPLNKADTACVLLAQSQALQGRPPACGTSPRGVLAAAGRYAGCTRCAEHQCLTYSSQLHVNSSAGFVHHACPMLGPSFFGYVCRLSFHACVPVLRDAASRMEWVVTICASVHRMARQRHMAGFLLLAPASCMSATWAWMSILPVCPDPKTFETSMGRPALQSRAANCFAVAGRGCMLPAHHDTRTA